MAATYTLPGVLLSGDHASRPAASAVAAGTLYAETDTGQAYQSDGASTWTAWGAVAGGIALASASYKRTSGDYSTSSTGFVDVDGTNLSLTITTGAHRVMLALTGSCYQSTSGQAVAFDVTVDGTRQGGVFGLVFVQAAASNAPTNCSFAYITDALSAGSHTFKLQWLVTANTGTLCGDASAASEIVSKFAAVELPA